MNRRLLVSLMAFGAVITLVGAAGIFAVFTDRATTGTNSVTSGARASAAHLQIAQGVPGDTNCGVTPAFSDDLATGIFTITDAQPDGFLSPSRHVCLRNAGSADLAISMAVIDLVNVETDCTGDEAAAGDNNCGIVGGVPGAGELAQVISASVVQVDCFGGPPIPGTGTTGSLQTLATIPGGASLGASMAPGAVICLQLDISYPNTTTNTAVLVAQSDQVTWRYAFDGTTS
jgi:hypothetical protein